MTNNFIFSFMFLMVFLASSVVVADDCQVRPELIFTLKKAEIGSYSVWDDAYGVNDRDERFIGALIDGRETVALGGRYALGNEDLREVLWVRFDHRGRPMAEQARPVKGLRDIAQFLPLGGGRGLAIGAQALAGGDMNEKSKKAPLSRVWLGVFDAKGMLEKEAFISADKGLGLRPHHIVRKKDGGYLLAASQHSAVEDLAAQSVLYHLDEDFKVERHMSFMPGVENRILSLYVLDDGGFLGTGFTTNVTDGRKVGWILLLDKNGQFVWSRQYARGSVSSLRRGSSYLGGQYFVVGGEVSPFKSSGGYQSAWVMVVDSGNGEVVWQRYYRGDLVHHMRDVFVQKDDTILTLLDVDPTSESDQDYAQILHLNRRGVLLNRDTYFHGKGVDAYSLISHENGQRFLSGQSKISRIIENSSSDDSRMVVSYDAWLSVADDVEGYVDPCY